MCLAISACLMVAIAVLSYVVWQFKEDMMYWMERSRELEDMLTRISDGETLEAIEKKTRHYNATGMKVDYES